MSLSCVRAAVACICLALVTCGCARDQVSARQEAAFHAARDRCGVTVADTAEVQRCMRAKGWAYRLPWQ